MALLKVRYQRGCGVARRVVVSWPRGTCPACRRNHMTVRGSNDSMATSPG